MPKQLAIHGSCTVLKRNTLLVFEALSDHDASASSPVLRKCDCSTTELLVPFQRLMPSAKRSRKRQWLMLSALALGPTQYPVLLCSTQMFCKMVPLPVTPLNPLSGELLSRRMVSPDTRKS